MKLPFFYRDQPVFGFDIGRSSVKVMQIQQSRGKDRVVGYGYTAFDTKAIKDGVIVDPEAIAKATFELMTKNLVGGIDSKRVAASLPVPSVYNRILILTEEKLATVAEAVQIEVEKYIPVPIKDLYYDYEVVRPDAKSKEAEVQIMASPKKVVDSYIKLFELLGLEVALLETTISSSTRLVMHVEASDVPTLVIDFGAISTDLSIFDTALRVASTVHGGGDTITKAISDSLGVSMQQAYQVKIEHGLYPSKHQKKVQQALEPLLSSMSEEIKKMIRYYQERTGKKRKLGQIIILGGGANVPGISDYLTNDVRVPTRMVDPWLNLGFGKLQPPHQSEKTLYATVAGLALVQPEDISK